MEIGSVTSLVSVSLAMLLALFGAFRYVTAQGEALRREIAAAQKEAALLVDKASESEAKQRHASNNNTQMLIAKIENEVRTLQRDTVRHEQMSALEQRMMAGLNKIEAKVDKLAETAAEIVAIRGTLQTVTSRLERISDRLDEASGHGKNIR